MLIHTTALSSLQAEWQGVVRMRQRMDELAAITFAWDAVTAPLFINILYNLPLVLAFNVLEHVLLQAKESGQFTCGGQQLEELMEGSRTALHWMDWQCMREALDHRNEVVWDGKLASNRQCVKDIAEIESQLIAWEIIPSSSVAL